MAVSYSCPHLPDANPPAEKSKDENPPLANCRIRQIQSAAAQPLLPADWRPGGADLGAIRAGNIRGNLKIVFTIELAPKEGHRKKSDRDHQVAENRRT